MFHVRQQWKCQQCENCIAYYFHLIEDKKRASIFTWIRARSKRAFLHVEECKNAQYGGRSISINAFTRAMHARPVCSGLNFIGCFGHRGTTIATMHAGEAQIARVLSDTHQ